MTLTTVGYGDLSPSTFPGKLIGNIKFYKENWNLLCSFLAVQTLFLYPDLLLMI